MTLPEKSAKDQAVLRYRNTKAAFHMSGPKGEYNLKFVSKGDQRYEAVYNKDHDLLTQRINSTNMGTYNYVGPDNEDGHYAYDVDPFFKYGNTSSSTGRGGLIECNSALENMKNLKKNNDAVEHYNKYADMFKLSRIFPVTMILNPKIEEMY